MSIHPSNAESKDEPTSLGHAETKADEMMKEGRHAAQAGAAEVKSNLHAVAQSVDSGADGFHELINAYQAIATERAQTMSETFQALAKVQSPTEFIQIQQNAISESINAAIRDSGKIARLTAEAMNAAFIPLQKRADQVERTAR